MTKNALDMIDEKIVELLQENARIAIKEIAAQVFLSSPAVTARIERLESKGIIKGYHAAVDSVNLGYKIKAFVNLDLEPVQKEEFYPFIESGECHRVQLCDRRVFYAHRGGVFEYGGA